MVSLKAIRSSPRSMASTCHPDHFNPVFLEHPGLGQFGGQIQTGLSSQIGKYGIGPFLFDNFLHGLKIEGLDISDISQCRDRS